MAVRVRLRDDQSEALRRHAATELRGVEDLARDAIDDYLAQVELRRIRTLTEDGSDAFAASSPRLAEPPATHQPPRRPSRRAVEADLEAAQPLRTKA